jgi:hypothetical protein
VRRLLLLFSAALVLRGDERTQKLVARLSEEADAFRRLAPQVLGEETLQQRALKPPPRFRPRMGHAAKGPPMPTWQEREIRSEYTFALFDGAMHELRQVTTVDGKKVQEPRSAQESLARIATASDDARKKLLLKEFEKHGLTGAATDFGQLLLLFAPREIVHYEFAYSHAERRREARILVFGYKQIDGSEALTLVDARRGDKTSQLPIEGEVWVLESNFLPVRITLAVTRGVGADQVREEAEVEYAMSAYGALLPASTGHRETRGGKLAAQNRFQYAEFRKFGASSDIKFDAGPERP